MVNKKYIWIVVVVIIIAVVLFILWYTRKKDISFDFTMQADANSILSNLQNRYAQRTNERGIGLYLDVPLTTIISNKSTSAIILKNIIGSLSYNNEAILQTKADSAALQNVPVGAKSSVPVTDNVQVLINPSSIKFFSELVKGNKPNIKYNFKTTVFGKPYSFSNSTMVNKKQL